MKEFKIYFTQPNNVVKSDMHTILGYANQVSKYQWNKTNVNYVDKVAIRLLENKYVVCTRKHNHKKGVANFWMLLFFIDI